MKVAIVAVGRVKERGLRAAIDDYVQRISRYAKVSEVELDDGPDADVEAKFRKAIPARARVVALEVDGTRLTSERFARWVEQCEIGAVPAVVHAVLDALKATGVKHIEMPITPEKVWRILGAAK